MARRPKSGPAPAHRATPATDETTSPLGAGVGPAGSPDPSALPAPTMTTASTGVGDAGIMVINAPEISAEPVLVPFVIVDPPVPASLAPGCRHAVMRAGWDGKGKGRKPIRRCDDCGYTEPRGEDGRPTVPWT